MPGDRDQHIVFADDRLGLVAAAAALAATVAGVAVAEAVPAPAVAAVPVVVVPAALVTAALVAATLVTAALVTAALVAAALVTAALLLARALVTAALVTAALVTAALVTAVLVTATLLVPAALVTAADASVPLPVARGARLLAGVVAARGRPATPVGALAIASLLSVVARRAVNHGAAALDRGRTACGALPMPASAERDASPMPLALLPPSPGCVDVCDSMASCSKVRSAPAPAGAPRWTELLEVSDLTGRRLLVLGRHRPETPAATATGASLLRRPALPPLLDGRDQLALAHPRGAGDAHRLGDSLKLGQQHRRQSPGPAGSAAEGFALASSLPVAVSTASGQERTAPARSWEVPADSATPTGWLYDPDEAGPDRSAESPFSAENRSKVSLTRGPSQGAGHGCTCGRWPAVVLLTCHRRLLAPQLAGHPGRGCVPQGSTLTRSLARAGQTGSSRDGQMNVEIARRRALGRQPERVRTSTCPHGGASGAASSLTPT